LRIVALPNIHFSQSEKQKSRAKRQSKSFADEILGHEKTSSNAVISKSTNDRRKVPVFEAVGGDSDDESIDTEQGMNVDEEEGTSIDRSNSRIKSIWKRDIIIGNNVFEI